MKYTFFQETKKHKLLLAFILILMIGVMFILTLSPALRADEEEAPRGVTVRAKVMEMAIDEEKQQQNPESDAGYEITYYQVNLKILSGEHKGETVYGEHVTDKRMVYNLIVEEGDEVLVYLDEDEEGKIVNAYVAEIYRQKNLTYLLALFLFTLVAVGGVKGLKTIVTLGITGVAVISVLLPGLLKGYSPILLTVAVCAVVTALTLFIISGVNRKTIAAIIGTTGGVLIAGIIALVFGYLTKLTGLGEEEAQMLMYIPQGGGLDFEGLLFAGIILGALGAVMDVGMSISSAMSEIEAIKPEISSKELIRSGMNVGRDVIGTMSNTLILAYAGASMPLMLLFLAHDIPVQEYLNWESISAEVVRTLAGSIGLILTIPLTALIAAGFRERRRTN